MQTYSPLVSEHLSVISVERLTDPDFWITDDKDIQPTDNEVFIIKQLLWKAS